MVHVFYAILKNLEALLGLLSFGTVGQKLEKMIFSKSVTGSS
jgi:hypothetical protein